MFQERSIAMEEWKENNATVTTASVRMGLDSLEGMEGVEDMEAVGVDITSNDCEHLYTIWEMYSKLFKVYNDKVVFWFKNYIFEI